MFYDGEAPAEQKTPEMGIEVDRLQVQHPLQRRISKYGTSRRVQTDPREVPSYSTRKQLAGITVEASENQKELGGEIWEVVLRTLSDYFTKFVDAIALLDKEAPSVASALFKVNDTKLYEYLNSAAE